MVPAETVTEIKEEVQMAYVATTISEHFINIGREIGRAEGEAIGTIQGSIATLQSVYKQGIITKEYLDTNMAVLQKDLADLEANKKS